MPAGGSRMPASVETVEKRLHYVKQEGQQVFRLPSARCTRLARRCSGPAWVNGERRQGSGVASGESAHHYGNGLERLGMSEDQVIINIGRYGNTTGATIPLATRDAIESGKLTKGDVVLFAAVGAGIHRRREFVALGILVRG